MEAIGLNSTADLLDSPLLLAVLLLHIGQGAYDKTFLAQSSGCGGGALARGMHGGLVSRGRGLCGGGPEEPCCAARGAATSAPASVCTAEDVLPAICCAARRRLHHPAERLPCSIGVLQAIRTSRRSPPRPSQQVGLAAGLPQSRPVTGPHPHVDKY